MTDTITSENITSTGLQKIYLYNSYFRGKFTEVSCVGHTNNIGNNSSGKTSILNLIPIFYGLEPSKLISRQAGKLPFAQFYLPETSSMIVFEYLKQTQSKCVVLFSRGGTSFAYKFVDCDAKNTLFTEESLDFLKKCKDVSEWLKNYVGKKLGVDQSRNIDSTLDYQAIISYDKKRLRQRGAVGRDLQQYAFKYSLCPIDAEMKHMGALTSVMLNERKMLEQLKVMLVDCYINDKAAIVIPKPGNNNDAIEDLNSMVKIQAEEHTLRDAINLKGNLDEIWSQIKGLDLLFKFRYEDLKAKKENFISKIREQRDKKSAENEEYTNQNSTLKSQRTDCEGQRTTLSLQVKSITDKKDEFDAQDIVQKSVEFKNLQNYRITMETDEAHLKGISDAFDEVTSRLDLEKYNQINSLRGTLDRTRNKLESDIENLKTEKKRLEIQLNQNLENLQLRYNQERDNFFNRRRDEKQLLNDEKFALKDKINLASQYTPQEQEDIDGLKKSIDECDERTDAAVNTYNQKLKVKTEIESKISDLKLELGAVDNELKAKTERRTNILKVLNPEDGTLLYFLEEQSIEWRESIGKVIRPDLLQTKGLSPSLGELTDSIYGLKLDLDKVSESEFLKDRDLLVKESEELKVQIDALEKEHDRLTNGHKNLLEELSLANGEIQKSLREMQRLRDEKEQAKLALNKELKEIKTLIEKRCLDLKEQLSLCEKQLSSFDNETDKKVEAFKQRFIEKNNEIKASFGIKQEPIDTDIDTKKEMIAKAENDFKQKLNEIEKSYEAALKQEGVDLSVLNEAKDRASKSRAIYETVSSYEELVNAYQTFLDSQWAKLDDLQARVRDLDSQIDSLTSQMANLKVDHERALDVIQAAINELTNQLNRITNDLENFESFKNNDALRSRLGQMPFDTEAAVVSEGKTNSLIVEELTNNLQKIGDIVTKIINAVNRVDGILSDISRGTLISNMWTTLKEDNEFEEKVRTDTDRYLLEVELLAKFLDEIIPLNKSAILETVKSAATSYHQFYASLQSFNTQVSLVSNSFAQQLNPHNPFEAISNIQIALISKLDNSPIFAQLKDYENEYQHWSDTKFEKLPESAFIDKFKLVTDALTHCEIKENLQELVDLSLSMEENGRLVKIRSDSDLSGVSSRGLSKLAIIVIFCGLTRNLCPDYSITIHWPLDEIGELYDENVVKLFELMDEYHISLFCAQPNPSANLLKFFNTKNFIDRNEGVKRCVSAYTLSPDNPLFNTLNQGVGDKENLESVLIESGNVEELKSDDSFDNTLGSQE